MDEGRATIITVLCLSNMARLPQKSSQEKLQYLVYLLALLKFILPLLIQNPIYEPHRDEFLYLAEARHMAWGYLEVPPLMSVLAYLTNLFGGGLFWIRIWPSLFGALTFVVVGRLILHLGGKEFALVLGFLPFVFGYYMHVHYIFQPNFLEVFFWTLMAYGLVRHIQTTNPRGLYIAGSDSDWG
jgi:4-amino-4-deoxy-L-arabinose transferase-like glycosyltransferase